MADYAKLSLLRYRWVGQTINLRELIGTLKSNPDWHKAEFYKTIMNALRPIVIETKEVDRDLRGAPLSGADLLKANLSRADLLKANLSGTYLREADLSGANLWGADLTRANLRGANLSRANLSESILSGADLTEADLSGANLCEADLSGADLWKANLFGALLREANLSGANLWETNLSGTDLGGVLFTTDKIFNRLLKWWGPKILSCIPLLNCMKPFKNWKKVGMTLLKGVDTAKINGSQNTILKRYIEDYQYIQGFKKKSWFHRWILYPLWKTTSDCGRCLLLWLIWSVGLMGLFSWVYYHHQADWFNKVHLNWLNVWYLSLTKFMSLGFGNAPLKIDHPTAQVWMMAEVVIGYVMFGGLISILINKLARRA